MSYCEGKVQHTKRKDALTEVKRLQERGDFVRAYKCVSCGFYHVGHVLPKEQKAYETAWNKSSQEARDAGPPWRCTVCRKERD